ncbi:MAG: phosphatidate cytidylyltransferase [Methylococcaceae bacterium]
MLAQRIITALILAALITVAVLLLPAEYFSLLMAIIVCIAAHEWCNLIGLDSVLKKALFFIALLLPMLGLHFWTQILELLAQIFDYPDIRTYSGILEWLVIIPVVFWVLAMLLIRNTPTQLLELQLKTRYKALIGWMVLLMVWLFFNRLRAFYGAEMAMYFLVLIWVADISAFFAGRKWGTTKLSPDISPGKTIAGMKGALLSAAICGIILSIILSLAYQPISFIVASDFVLLSVLTVLISIYGDLFFSLVKRQRGVKDSGNLLPGHGGMLDRIDSIIAAAPFFYAGIFLIYRSLE